MTTPNDTTRSGIDQLRADYESGALARNDYWKAMQAHHLDLLHYSDLIQGDLLDHIEIHPAGLRVVLKNGLHFAWDPHEIRVAPSVLVNHGEYEDDELTTLLALAQGCRNILDIGANIGWYSLHLAQIVQPQGGVVYAFEPIPTTYGALEHNITLNPALQAHVQTYALALGENSGTVEFYIPAFQGSVAASRSALFPEDENQVVQGEMTTLDAFVRKHDVQNIDMLKCDVEGAELFVIKGGLATIQAHRPLIMLEMLRKWAKKFDYHPDAIINLLGEHGYTCWYAEDDRFHPLATMGEDVEAVNFFLLHEDTHADILRQWRDGISVSTWAARRGPAL
jgi:FkbM family methyltransferase